MTKAEARRYIWSAMASTLANDLHDNAAAYIYEDDHSEKDRERIIEAAEEILARMWRRAGS